MSAVLVLLPAFFNAPRWKRGQSFGCSPYFGFPATCVSTNLCYSSEESCRGSWMLWSALGSFVPLAQTVRSRFVRGLCCSPAHPSCQQAPAGTVLVGCVLPVDPTPQSPGDAPCVPVEVSPVALAVTWCQDPCWGSQGLCSAGTFSPGVPEQLWVCRCWRGERVCVPLAMAVLWLSAVSFVGCCPDRKANYFV